MRSPSCIYLKIFRFAYIQEDSISKLNVLGQLLSLSRWKQFTELRDSITFITGSEWRGTYEDRFNCQELGFMISTDIWNVFPLILIDWIWACVGLKLKLLHLHTSFGHACTLYNNKKIWPFGREWNFKSLLALHIEKWF